MDGFVVRNLVTFLDDVSVGEEAFFAVMKSDKISKIHRTKILNYVMSLDFFKTRVLELLREEIGLKCTYYDENLKLRLKEKEILNDKNDLKNLYNQICE